MRSWLNRFVNIWTLLLVVFIAFILSCMSVAQNDIRAADNSLPGSMASWQGVSLWLTWGTICSTAFPLLRKRQMYRYELAKLGVASFLLVSFLIVWLAPNIWNYSDAVNLRPYIELVFTSWLSFLSLSICMSLLSAKKKGKRS